MASNKIAKNENGMVPMVPMRSSVLKLKPLDSKNQSALLLRRTSRKSLQQNEPFLGLNTQCGSGGYGFGAPQICSQCHEGFPPEAEVIQSGGQFWHKSCFVCVQCFQPFPDGIYYEFENRRYCSHDFNMLFAPTCGKCREFISGRVIRAMNASWHPECFTCDVCNAVLSETRFMKSGKRALCRECHAKEKAQGLGKYICFKCHSVIVEGPLKYKSEVYHPYHFNCSQCNIELNSDAREVKGELLCLRCYDRTKVPICGACRRPVEERVVHALGKQWHPEHFVCNMCERPFHGTRHFEKGDKAYCEQHYYQLFGDTCFTCNRVVVGEVFTALNKTWCIDHFQCFLCNQKMNNKTKFVEIDMKPACKKCYKRLPSELRKRLKKQWAQSKKK